jgi:beta-xylosidase
LRQPDVLRSRPRRALVVAATMVLLGVPTGYSSKADPAYVGDFPDPAVLRVGRSFYAYGTNISGRQLPVLVSSDLRSWSGDEDAEPPAEALPRVAVWGVDLETSGPSKQVWAPGVFRYRGSYIAFYALRSRALSRRTCISVATSSSPTGPFVDRSTQPVVCDEDPLGSIDPQPYVDPATGSAYLTWKSEGEAHVTPTRLWAQRLDGSGTALLGSAPRRMLLETAQRWEGRIIENPSMTRYAGRWWLFYSGNDWASARYAVGYASCAGPTGPCTRAAARPLLASTAGSLGPGGASAFLDARGALRLAYHYWPGPTTGYVGTNVRRLAVTTLHLDGTGHLAPR